MRKTSRGSRAFIARLEGLEARRLLTLSITQVSQVAFDFVTSTPNPGADGTEDVQIALSNLTPGVEVATADVVGTLTNKARH